MTSRSLAQADRLQFGDLVAARRGESCLDAINRVLIMDGVTEVRSISATGRRQQTLKSAISCVGFGLHSGLRVQTSLLPAPAGSGIQFRRIDLGAEIPARFDHVTETRLCTQLGLPNRPEARVATVEHLMAALWAAEIDNVAVEVDGPELPILDGSAAPWMFLLDCAGRIEQEPRCAVIEIIKPVRVEDGRAFVELRPALPAVGGLELTISIEFGAAAIGRQRLSLSLSPQNFRRQLASARTFTEMREVESLRAAGLALGGSLDNAVVVDEEQVLNPGGLRMSDEFVRHKLVDAVGDLALAGVGIRGRFLGHRSGHALNNRLLRAIFADPTAWRPIADEPGSASWTGLRLPVAAAPV